MNPYNDTNLSDILSGTVMISAIFLTLGLFLPDPPISATQKPKEMNVPAALSSRHMEIYVLDGEIHFIKNGNVLSFEEMDVNDLAVLREVLDEDTEAISALEANGINDPVEQLKKFVACNFGNFDSRADLTEDGIIMREYWECGNRGACLLEGKLCKLPSGLNGRITPREIEVIKLIGQDLADKQIADHLGISVNTVHVHRANIEGKIPAFSKAGVVVWGIDKGIIPSH